MDRYVREYIELIAQIAIVIVLYNLQVYEILPWDIHAGLHIFGISIIFCIITNIMQYCNHYSGALQLVHIEFVIMCIMLYYSKSWIDFVIFISQIAWLLGRVEIISRKYHEHE